MLVSSDGDEEDDVDVDALAAVLAARREEGRWEDAVWGDAKDFLTNDDFTLDACSRNQRV